MIDCSNGEGLKVIVCGFGLDYNMVILNGCIMLVVLFFVGGGFLNFCVYDFVNLVLESVKLVEVYKIGKVNIVLGGIGVIININIVCFLDNLGLIINVGVKVMYDIINCVGDDIILEILGIFSWIDEEVKFGVLFIVSV